MTSRISFANKTGKKLTLVTSCGSRSSLIVMRKCRATCLLCKYHAIKIDSSFHNWLNWGLTPARGINVSTWVSIFYLLFLLFYMDANWRRLNATLTAQTNGNEVPPESLCWNVLWNSSRIYQLKGYAISSTRRRVLSFGKLGLFNSRMASYRQFGYIESTPLKRRWHFLFIRGANILEGMVITTIQSPPLRKFTL